MSTAIGGSYVAVVKGWLLPRQRTASGAAGSRWPAILRGRAPRVRTRIHYDGKDRYIERITARMMGPNDRTSPRTPPG